MKTLPQLSEAGVCSRVRACGQVPKYDAHVVYVTAPPSTPCPPEEWEAAKVYLELVLFENAAILPRFILSLDVP